MTTEAPPDGYRCVLDDAPGFLVPARLLSKEFAGADASDVVVAENVRIARDADGGGTVWVADPVYGPSLPFRVSQPILDALDGAHTGAALRVVASRRIERLLIAAGVLVPRHPAAGRGDNGTARDGDPRDSYRMLDYAQLPAVIHPFHLGSLRTHYRRLARSGALKDGDTQSPNRMVAYEEPVARFYLHQLAPYVSHVVGRPVVASYVYSAYYHDGARLPVHTDREACEHTMTVCIDYSPDLAEATPWPLELVLPHRRLLLYQAIGDGILFRGRRIPHARRPLPGGHTSTSLFFHYVEAGDG